jgi:hypothetical protein
MELLLVAGLQATSICRLAFDNLSRTNLEITLDFEARANNSVLVTGEVQPSGLSKLNSAEKIAAAVAGQIGGRRRAW